MEITEVRIKLMEDSDDRLQAFCSITIDDCFVIRDLKIIEGTSGPFVAMPSRKLTAHCPHCGTKNHLRSGYCNNCGGRLKEDRTVRDADGRAKLYADIAHPINSQCREMIQRHVIDEYRAERERAKQPDYVSRYDDSYEDEFEGSELAEEYDRVRQAQDVAKRGTAERTQIQPAEVEPRAPHIAASQLPVKEPPRRNSDQFGAGIFD
jgi:stage V sporulation protein G